MAKPVLIDSGDTERIYKHVEQALTARFAFFKKTQKFLEKTHPRQRKDLLKTERHRMDIYRRMDLAPCLELTE